MDTVPSGFSLPAEVFEPPPPPHALSVMASAAGNATHATSDRDTSLSRLSPASPQLLRAHASPGGLVHLPKRERTLTGVSRSTRTESGHKLVTITSSRP